MTKCRRSRQEGERPAAIKPRCYKSRDLPLVMKLLEIGRDDYDIAYVLGISLEELNAAALKDRVLQQALNSREEVRLWNEERNMEIARQLAARGYSDIDLCEAFGASSRVIFLWRLTNPKFDAALEMTQEIKIRTVERTALRMATGYMFDDVVYRDTKSGRKKLREQRIVSTAKPEFFLSANNADKYGTIPRSGKRVEEDPLDDIGELLSRGLGTVVPVEKDAG